MKHFNKYIALAVGLTLIACAKTSYQAGDGADENGQQKIPVEPNYNRPACEVNYWDQSMDINLYSYEFSSSNGVKFGFNGLGIIDFIGLDVNVDKAKLYMRVDTANPFENENGYLASASDSDVKFGVNVNFGNIGVGFDHYSNTPVAKLTRKGLMNSVQGLKDKVFNLAKYKREWSTRVLSSPLANRDKVIIQAGADAGITDGDEFQVFNINHYWKGEPCNSAYLGYEPENGWDKPVATLRATRSVDSARQFAMLTMVDPRISNQDILPGAYVRQVPAAKGKKLKPLARSIKINSITSGDLVLKDGRKIDLTGYMKKQVSDVLADKEWKNQFYMYAN